MRVTPHVGLPDGNVLACQRPVPDGPGEVIAWEYAPVLASGERWAARGELGAREAQKQWSSGEFADGSEYDPVVGIDRRTVVIVYGEWERC